MSNQQQPPTKPHPPSWAQRLIEWYCKPQFVEDLMGDLHEYFERNVESKGLWRAKIIYIIDAFKFFRLYTVRAPKFLNVLINWIMIGSYVRTSLRSMERNKLFSAINIAGLAIGMSVSLLLIAFVHDLRSYDRFHDQGDRIYRITSVAKFKSGPREKFASASVKNRSLIQDHVVGVQAITMICNEVTGDANINGNLIPFTGAYAEPSIFQIFTLPMLKGDATTALRSPYSIVLTETSAKKFFGEEDAFGKNISLDNVNYQVTGIMGDLPFFSHLQFESLISFSTLEIRRANDKTFRSWERVWDRNYIYILLSPGSNLSSVQGQLHAICATENKTADKATVELTLLPLFDIMLGEKLSNSNSPVIPGVVLWIVGGLALIVMLSACFNYTNLSIARATRRLKEVGLRKAIGAGRSQVRLQFLAESVIISLAALLLSFAMFMVLRPQLLSISPELLKMVKLHLTVPMTIAFVGFALSVGLLAGVLPAIFFAKVSIVNGLRDMSSVQIFRGLNFRRALFVVQYTLTLIFITSTVIGYVQYKNILAFDLGFNTENILNISLQKNKPDALVEKLKAMPEVSGVSQSRLLTSVGNAWGGYMKYKDMKDSAIVLTNIIDEHYIPLHNYNLIAGQNFITRPVTKDATSEVIVNEKTLKLFSIADRNPVKAVGEEIVLNSKRLTIVGVIKDFHYSKLDEHINPVVFTYLTPDAFLTSDGRDGLINVRVSTTDPVATLAKIEAMWNSVDPVHPFEGQFYDDAIEQAYAELSAMIKVIGYLSFVAISIASLGLFGMVVYTTETRLREISIRKVLGATSSNLVIMLGTGFVVLLLVSALIALPITYLFFERLVLTSFPFHNPVGLAELFAGLLVVLTIALLMIGSQTIGAAQRNPSEVLKSE